MARKKSDETEAAVDKTENTVNEPIPAALRDGEGTSSTGAGWDVNAWSDLEDDARDGTWRPPTGESEIVGRQRLGDVTVAAEASTGTETQSLPEERSVSDVSASRSLAEAKADPSVAGETPPPARLICMEGADQGRVFEGLGGLVTVGRGAQNTIVLADGSVSRHHATLQHEGETYVLVDKGSANGTFVNGERVTTATLEHSDEIGFGHTTFLFELGADAAALPPSVHIDPAAGARQRRRMLWSWRQLPGVARVGVVLLGAVLLGVGWGLIPALFQPLPDTARMPSAVPDEPEDLEALLDAWLGQGVEAYQAGAYDVAQRAFEDVLRHDPGHAVARDYLNQIAEKRAERAYAEAQQRLDGGELAAAKQLAESLLGGTYDQQARDILAQVAALIDADVRRARQALRAGRVEEARGIVDALLAVFPERRELTALLEQVERQAAAQALRQDKARRMRAAQDAAQARFPKVRQAVGDRQFEVAREFLRMEADAPDAPLLKAAIDRCALLYGRGSDAHRNKRIEAALRYLEEVQPLAMDIVGAPSALSRDVDRKLADMYYARGIAKMLGGRLEAAYTDFALAHEAFETHRPTQRAFEDLEMRAEALFLEAERDESTAPEAAAAVYERVLHIVRPASPLHRQAKASLTALNRRRKR